MDVHCRGDPCVVNLFAGNGMSNNQSAPFRVDAGIIRKNCKNTFKNTYVVIDLFRCLT